MESLQQRLDLWIRQQRQSVPWLRWNWKQKWTWPWPWQWQADKEHRQRLQEEYNRRRYQLQALCGAVKADTVADLQDVLSAMVLSECVYKKPASEVIRAVNKFKADFGGHVVSLECVQPSLDHVPHRYLLAEAGDTLFVSFIGTKQYKDIMADANILQGAVFHDDAKEDSLLGEKDGSVNQGGTAHNGGQVGPKLIKSLQVKPEVHKGVSKPAAHRGFLARAKGIPALELYRLAQKRDRKLVLCGHSLGGAVAVLATLAILRVFASSSLLKDSDKIQVKCITFSQPPVGNAALRDYVQRKGWQQHFRTYCIPEDLVPRILSPAYFQHYRAQASEGTIDNGVYNSPSQASNGLISETSRPIKSKQNEGERLVLGLGPVQNSFVRLSRLVPLLSLQKPLNWFRGRREGTDATNVEADSGITSVDEGEESPQSLEIQEGVDGISLTPISDVDKGSSEAIKNAPVTGSREEKGGKSVYWHRVPSLPSYVPFGQLYLLGKSSVEPLSASEYSKLTSVQSVLAELRQRFQSHSMRSYRSRFQKIYELCMGNNAGSVLGMEHLPHLPHLQQWLGLAVAGAAELGQIAEPLIVRTATSLVPLDWSGAPGEKNGSEPLRVDVHGYGLHLCTLVQAQVNGRWCSTTVESLPPPPPLSLSYQGQPNLQKMQLQIGAPLKQSSKQQINAASIASGSVLGEGFPGPDTNSPNPNLSLENGISSGSGKFQVEGLSEVTVHCSSDFVTMSKEVCMRLRRVRLLGLEGAGKTSLYYAILGRCRGTTAVRHEGILPDTEWHEGVAGGICFTDAAGVNLQELPGEVNQLKRELCVGLGQLNRKIDLVILVHNLAHKVPRLHQGHTSAQSRPALSLLLDEIGAVGIPLVLAMTNMFAVSADRRDSVANAVMEAYQVPSNMAVMVNSCPYAVHATRSEWVSNKVTSREPAGNNLLQGTAQRFILAPISLVRMPFQKKEVILPVDGVTTLQKLIRNVLMSHEESAFQELARERLLLEAAKEQSQAGTLGRSQGTASSATAALVGASLGAGLGVVMAVIMGAASALRKP